MDASADNHRPNRATGFLSRLVRGMLAVWLAIVMVLAGPVHHLGHDHGPGREYTECHHHREGGVMALGRTHHPVDCLICQFTRSLGTWGLVGAIFRGPEEATFAAFTTAPRLGLPAVLLTYWGRGPPGMA